MTVINFHFQQAYTLRERTRLRTFIRAVFKKYKIALNSLNLVFCSDEFLLDINRTYLKHDYYTDIITFDLGEGEAEIYISIDRVRENAKAEGASFNHELHRVIFHGVLHLCGFKDKSARNKSEMTRQ
ncbi:MAG TPA: rRNA maturation RNase YbeY, partial [Chitinophagaceae bacterium]|nr:rRNA maturation RNase YbeY [Chitinophagaceae bacterium]